MLGNNGRKLKKIAEKLQKIVGKFKKLLKIVENNSKFTKLNKNVKIVGNCRNG